MRYWKRTKPDGTTRTVESYAQDNKIVGAIEITKAEFDQFIASLPPPPAPIDWKALYKAASSLPPPLAHEAQHDIIAKRLGLKGMEG